MKSDAIQEEGGGVEPPTGLIRPSVPPGADARVGTRLGKYQLQKLIGSGGMGTVYEALDTFLKRRVAVKVLPESLAAGDALRRFVLEARAFARVNHPNAVAIYEVDRRDAVVYLVLELMRGGSLHDLLAGRGPLEWPQATQAIIDACRALVATHGAGLIHRDVKPANLMLSGTGIVKLADFGLAKQFDKSSGLTIANSVMGTPHYMSPEQCRGETIDFRTDLYSLGATYYTLLTGVTPFRGDMPVQILFAHCSAEIPDPRQLNPLIPEACSQIIARAMAKDPADRYRSAEEMLADLEKLMTDGTHFVFAGVGESADATEASVLQDVAAAADLAASSRVQEAIPDEQESYYQPIAAGASIGSGSRGIGGAVIAMLLSIVAVSAVTIGSAWYLRVWPFAPKPLPAGIAARPAPRSPATTRATTRPAVHLHYKWVAGSSFLLDSGDRVESVTVSPDGKRLAVGRVGSTTRGVDLWDTESGKKLPSPFPSFAARSVSLSSGVKHFVAVGGTAGLSIRDSATGDEVTPQGADSIGQVIAVAFSRGGGSLAVAAKLDPKRSMLHVFEVPSGRDVKTTLISKAMDKLALAPAADFVAYGGADGVVLWRIKGAQRLDDLPGFSKVTALAFSPKSALLAIASPSGVQFWDPSTSTRLTEVWSIPADVTALCFTSDNRLLVAGCADGSIRSWSVPDKKEVRAQRFPRGTVTSLAFVNGTHVLVSGGTDGAVRITDVNKKPPASNPSR